MRTFTRRKGGQTITVELPDLTAEEQAAIDARKALIAKRRLQREAEAERAALRNTAVDQVIKAGAVSVELRTYAAALDAIITADAKDIPGNTLPAKPASLEEAVKP